MEMLDRLPQAGILEYRVRRRGRVVEVFQDENLIVNGARDAMAQLLGGDGAGKTINRIGFGTNGLAPSGPDAALTGGYLKLLGPHIYPTTGKIQWSWTLGTAEANGVSIREMGLLCTDGTLFSRKTRSAGAIEKDSDVDLEGTWTIIF